MRCTNLESPRGGNLLWAPARERLQLKYGHNGTVARFFIDVVLVTASYRLLFHNQGSYRPIFKGFSTKGFSTSCFLNESATLCRQRFIYWKNPSWQKTASSRFFTPLHSLTTRHSQVCRQKSSVSEQTDSKAYEPFGLQVSKFARIGKYAISRGATIDPCAISLLKRPFWLKTWKAYAPTDVILGAAKRCTAGKTIISLPHSLTFSEKFVHWDDTNKSTFKHSKILYHLFESIQSHSSWQVRLALCGWYATRIANRSHLEDQTEILLSPCELLRTIEHMAVYFNSCPSLITHLPMFWPSSKIKKLPPVLSNAIRHQSFDLQRLVKIYQENVHGQAWHSSPPSKPFLTHPDYNPIYDIAWTLGTISSRSLTITKENERIQVLLPVIDYCARGIAGGNTQLIVDKKGVHLLATSDILPGEPFVIEDGEYSTEEVLLRSGDVISDNPYVTNTLTRPKCNFLPIPVGYNFRSLFYTMWFQQ
eukprot:GHVT01032961.1.p1 GENE.GHVT01032961.1~~GHVT01032961.1.p1  ORF type:complete len:477 (+),score=-5.36 GHVT01032961.1:175-1605(+)